MAQITIADFVRSHPETSSQNLTESRRLNLEIHDKELLVLLGPVGSGKTALFRMIAGLDEIRQGELRIGANKANSLGPAEREISWVPADAALLPKHTVDMNLGFGSKLRKTPQPEQERRVKEAATILGLESLLQKPVELLTLADRQRVALARAIVRQPKCLLLDDPTAGLDREQQRKLHSEIVRLHERTRLTIIFATSNPMEAMFMGDRIAILDRGEIVQIDTPAAIYNNPATLFVAGIFGAPPMNLIRGIVRKVSDPRIGDSLQFREGGEGSIVLNLGEPGQWSMLSRQVGREVVLGIRPEEIHPASGDEPSRRVIKGLVEQLEPKGDQTVIQFQTGAHLLASTCDSFLDRSEVGRRMQFELKLSKACFFDPETTLRIDSPRG